MLEYFVEHHQWIGTVYIWIYYKNTGLQVGKIGQNGRSLELIGNEEKNNQFVIELPCAVEPTRAKLNYKGDLYSLRLTAVKNEQRFDRSSNHIMEEVVSKWMRKDLVKGPFTFYCSCCNDQLICSKDYTRVRDMPSEFWAEFMDYWHCHKPHSDTNSTLSKGFDNKFTKSVVPTVGEICLSDSFIYIHKDSFNHKIVYDYNNVLCNSCRQVLGSVNRDGSIGFKKWCLKAEINKEIETIDISNYVLNQIFNELKAHSTRLFHIRDNSIAMEVQVWVFGFGSTISFSNSHLLTNCMKILYQGGGPPNGPQNSQNIELIEVDEPNALSAFISRLDDVNSNLPHDLQRMNEWKVGYISCD